MGVTVNERRGEGHQSWKSFWLFSTFTIFPTQRKILVLKNANDAVEGKNPWRIFDIQCLGNLTSQFSQKESII